MFQKIQEKLLHIPLALTAVGLGLTTLAGGWDQFHSGLAGPSFDGSWVKYLTIGFAALFWILSVLKVLSNPKWVWQEMKSGSASSHLPVLFMLTIAIGQFFIGLNTSGIYSGFYYYFGLILWYVGLIFQLGYLVWWIISRTIWFDIKDVDAAWYVPWVGIPVACAIAPNALGANYAEFLQGLWYFSFIGFILLTVLILYRYLFVNPIHTKELPAIGIIAAPASLLLVTYFLDFSATKSINPALMLLLAGLAITFTLIGYISLIKIVMIKFNPGVAAYSFPLAVGALARLVFAAWLVNFSGFTIAADAQLIKILTIEGFVELIISTIIIIYLVIGFAVHTISKMIIKNHQATTIPKVINYFM